jgi:sulfite exporter TauE/SafE
MEASIFGAVLVMGFLGSWHCGVMCGPLSCNFRKRESFISYHLGRLLSYAIISTLLFYGARYFLDTDSRALKLGASLFFGLLLIIFGLMQIQIIPQQKKLSFKFFKVQHKILEKYKMQLNQFPILLGLLTGLLPCGWLYSFLIMSSQMKSIAQSLAVISIFWVTSLPAFFVFTGFMSHLIKKSPASHQRISASVLILAGLFSILGHWSHILFLQ